MSALTKPFIHSTNTIGGASSPINAELVASFEKLTVDTNQAVGSIPTYEIVFVLGSHGNNPREVKWRYATDTLRDADYAAVLALVSVAV